MNMVLIRIREIITQTGLSDTSFAESIRIRQSTLSNMFLRNSFPKAEILRKIVEKYKINSGWLLTGKGEMFLTDTPLENDITPAKDTSVKIPLLRQKVSCEPGQNWEESDAIESYIEPLGFFPALTRAKVYAFRVSGVSMTGVGIMDGDVVLFDANPEQNLRDDIYVFAWGGEVYCKLLRFDKLKKEIYIYSVMNRDLTEAELLKVIKQDDPETASAFRVFGRVVAWMHENRLMYRK